jgi:Na+/melibiose symporter-like transporter
MPHIIVRFMAIEKPSMIKKSATVAIIWVILTLGAAIAIAIMGTMGYVNNAINPETGAAFIDVNLISWEHTLQIRSLVAILYLVAGIMLFVGLGVIYNLDKKTMDQMNAELAARKK